MREIDGSYGEGGGQLLRTAVALAAISGETIRVVNIRAKRSNPGLAAQHLTAVKSVAALCDAQVDGLEVKSREIVFRPGSLHGGEFQFDVGTAGSVTLVLQAVLPVAIATGKKSLLRIVGGTDVRAAPPLDYVRLVLLSSLARMGVTVEIAVLRRGYYPRGGGEILASVAPAQRLQPIMLDSPGSLKEIRGAAHIANLPEHIVQRMAHAATRMLAAYPQIAIEQQLLGKGEAIGAGGAIVLAAHTGNTVLGAAATAERGVTAESLGKAVGKALGEELATGATLDLHASDQMLVYLALANGRSTFLARALSSHAATTIRLLEQFLPVPQFPRLKFLTLRIAVRSGSDFCGAAGRRSANGNETLRPAPPNSKIVIFQKSGRAPPSGYGSAGAMKRGVGASYGADACANR